MNLRIFQGIRGKLLLVSLVLLAIPVLGYRFINDMEAFLREGQELALASTTRAIAATLSDRPRLFLTPQDTPGDDAALERRKILALFSTSDPETLAELGTAYAPSEEIERILGLLSRSASRIWVVDTRSRVRGLSGTLKGQAAQEETRDTQRGDWLARLLVRWTRLSASSERDAPGSASQAVMAQVDRALIGVPTAYWRLAHDRRGVILSAAQPVWVGDNIVGAVVVEETTGAIQALKLNALSNLLTITLIVFLAGFVTLLLFASRLAARVRKLGLEAETAIDAQGRIRGDIVASREKDEIGELSRHLSAVVRRLGDYNAYLESMAGKLSHELRTPVAVVRSSLDNLMLHTPGDSETQVYIERANVGVMRLSSLISRLSEATRLEHFLQNAGCEAFDLRTVIAGCVEGYRGAYPGQGFAFDAGSGTLCIEGVPDAIAQLLDKLVANAMDFCAPGAAIAISLHGEGSEAVLSVGNTGPLLPQGLDQALFSSMVSVRPEHHGGVEGNVGHLGLGLYLVRLIADFHGGRATLKNRPDGGGVTAIVALPLHRKPEETIRRS